MSRDGALTSDDPSNRAPRNPDHNPTNPRDHDHHPARVPGDQATDSAGLPWQARALTSTGFDDDAGTADPTVRTMLVGYAAHPTDRDDSGLMAVVAGARLLVPVVAEPVELSTSAAGLATDAHVDMAAVTLVAPDGTRALPVFTGLDSLGAWDATARPVPVTAASAAQAAVTERCDVIVLDPAGPAQVVLRPSMVWALAQQRAWVPASNDPVVDAAVAAATDPEPAVMAYGLTAGEPAGTLRVELSLRPGLSEGEVAALATRIGERLATDGEVRARIDGLAFAVTPMERPLA